MLVLAIDTTSQQGGAGVFRDGLPLAIIPNESPANLYSVTLFDMTERAIRKAGVSLREIELFAVSNGPGSFTGIRVGLAAAQAWAKAFGRPAVGVSNLLAMVETAHPLAEWALPILDARRGEFYLGRFHRSSNSTDARGPISPVDEGLVAKASEIAEMNAKTSQNGSPDAAWVVREDDRAAGALRRSLGLRGEWFELAGTLLPAIAKVAAQQWSGGEDHSLDELQPRYIRRPDAELNWRG